MKRSSEALFLMAVAAAAAFACAPAHAAGITGGGTAATLLGEDVDDDEARLGHSIGLYFSARAKDFEFRPEILFVNMGTSDKALLPALATGPVEFTLDYVQVPFLFKMTAATGEQGGAGLFFGPYFAYNMKAEVTREIGGVPVTTDIGELVRETDVGIVAGLSYDAPFWSLDVRYTYGFDRVFKGSTIDARNASVSVMLGIRF